jgi:two-component system, NarL family, nitrate/nitrite response regulator NarL
METAPTILNSDNVKRFTALTDREGEVAGLVCEGLPNKMIARRLGVTEGTVKIHLHMIFKKLAVRSRADLIIHIVATASAT